MEQSLYEKIDLGAVSLIHGPRFSLHLCIDSNQNRNEYIFLLLFQVIITQTVGQMTDMLPSTTIATQTPLPRTHLSFASLATVHGRVQADQKSSPFEQQMLENELLLQTQRNSLKIVDLKLNDKHFDERNAYEVNVSGENVMRSDEQHDSTSQSHTPSVPESTAHHIKIDQIAVKMVILWLSYSYMFNVLKQYIFTLQRENSIKSVPFTCWDDFDFPDSDNELPDLPKRSISDGSTPWNNFNEIVIGQR